MQPKRVYLFSIFGEYFFAEFSERFYLKPSLVERLQVSLGSSGSGLNEDEVRLKIVIWATSIGTETFISIRKVWKSQEKNHEVPDFTIN